MKLRKALQRDKYLILLSATGVLLLIVFNYIPMAGIIVAFKRFSPAKGIFGSEWVGLKYFIDFFQGPYFVRLIRNTFLLNFFSLLFGFPAPIILAILFNELRNGFYKRFSQTVSYLPYFISTVIIVGMMKSFFSLGGLVNQLIASIGLEKVEFFSRPEWFRPLYIGSGIWQGMGFGSIIYLAALAGVDVELYEAALIDGANRWHLTRYINLPSIKPVITIILILNIGSMLSVGFEKVYLMYNASIFVTADVIATYVYRMGIEGAQYSYGAAVGLFNSAANFLLLVFANFISRRMNETSLW